MIKMTLLEMVQNILSALDSDEVNSINDTVESLQVAETIKETFYEQFNNIYIPEFQGIFRLESLNDLSRPNYMRLPSNVARVDWLKYRDYRNEDRMNYVEYVSPDVFFDRQIGFIGVDDANSVTVVDAGGLEYTIEANRFPTCFTMLEDDLLLFDAFDSAFETTLEGSNSLGLGLKTFVFEMDDDYIPPIDGNLFPLLLSESKATAFINLKQISSSKEEQRARRQRIRMQNDQFKSRQAQRGHWAHRGNYARHRS